MVSCLKRVYIKNCYCLLYLIICICLVIGGGDHKHTQIRNIVALVGMCNILELARVVLFRNVPDGSYVNEVKRQMSYLT